MVAVDYFTKWAEAEALANIRDVDVKKFVWKNIITKFGVSDSLISDNGLQLIAELFANFATISVSGTSILLRRIPKATARLRP